jgi:hypothetical protein
MSISVTLRQVWWRRLCPGLHQQTIYHCSHEMTGGPTMLGRKKYTREEVDHARSGVAEQLAA